jgi:hypothetical protein
LTFYKQVCTTFLLPKLFSFSYSVPVYSGHCGWSFIVLQLWNLTFQMHVYPLLTSVHDCVYFPILIFTGAQSFWVFFEHINLLPKELPQLLTYNSFSRTWQVVKCFSIFYLFGYPWVSVCLCFYTKMLGTRWFINNKNLFFIVLKTEKSKIKLSADTMFVKVLLSASKVAYYCCIL